jgi:primosomal protein N' (replication factor Y) (superfamily II helicase)
MYIATVIPIKKGIHKESLTYFSMNKIPLGSIVTVPVRRQEIRAIVIDIEDARERKSDLKTADFQLKKVIDTKGFSPFTTEFFTACERMTPYTVSNTGTIIKNMLPSVFLDNISRLKLPPPTEAPVEKSNNEALDPHANPEYRAVAHEKLIFQARDEDRLGFYRTLIREAFAKRESLFICVPTRYDIEVYKEALTKGISEYVYSFHNDLPKKVLIDTYNNVVTDPHPILIIGTGLFLSIPRRDVKTIVIERESSDSYKQQMRPYIDIRTFAEVLASVNKTKLIMSDTLLRPDTLYRHEQGELGEIHPPHFRLSEVERKIVVDMKEEATKKKEQQKDATFAVLSDTTRAMITYASERGESVFLYSLRKGLAPVTVCHDCGHTLLCPDCETPIVLYGSKKVSSDKSTGRESVSTETTRLFMCNKCGRKDTTEVRCPACASWNLTPLGIGTDRVEAEIRELFPHIQIIQVDKEVTPSDSEAQSAIARFTKNPGSILIGTEMVFSYLREPVNHSTIVSLDGLLSIPSFNITQKILRIIEKMHQMTRHNLIIQTRIPENQVLGQILSGNVLPLYREDLRDRKQYGYPPFKRLIKITFAGSKVETERARAFLDDVLSEYDPQIFSAFISKVRGQYITNTIIKVNPTIWPLPLNDKSAVSHDLLSKLRLLPPSFLINVDPEDLL